MSDQIKHECGVAFIRLRKPLQYYIEKYGTPTYGLDKLYLLMEKQHNRGQDGAGIATIKIDVPPGNRFISRYRSNSNQPIKDIFNKVYKKFEAVSEKNPALLKDAEWLKNNVAFTGEAMLGHLRYGTHGQNSIEACHPFLRQNNWMTRNCILAGNFNMTNVDELFKELVDIGQNPKEKSDTVTVLELIGQFLDEENDKLYYEYKDLGKSKREITELISKNLKVENILKPAAQKFDGGYVLTGLLGHGDAFVLRDPSGIRPAFYYMDDEVLVVASERPAIQTAFDLKIGDLKALDPGHAIISKKDGSVSITKCVEPKERKECSFERIYFSRGSDFDIYNERKQLGKELTKTVLEKVDNDIENTVFSYIPNTAETAFFGLVKGIEKNIKEYQLKALSGKLGDISEEKLSKIINLKPRVEKLVIKDAKLRTFITQDLSRDDLVAHVYDITYGQINDHKDTLVLLDDSIVRGTTLKNSILKIVDRLKPKKVLIVSSAPQIRFPDCYGIDMSKLNDFIAFRAAIALLYDHDKEYIIDEVYDECLAQVSKPRKEVVNVVKKIYEPFSATEISNKIAEIIKPKGMSAEFEVVYQTIAALHKACPNHLGDWYFTGNYPTPGGNKVAVKSFINFFEKINERAY
jgi:amidophosphoribosyltransferase